MFQKALGVFFEEKETPPPTPKAVSAISTVPYVSPSTYLTPVSTGANVHIKEKITTEVAAKFATSPYLQFQKVSNGMRSKINDVPTRFLASGSALEVQGITKQAILDGTNSILVFLNTEGAEFESSTAIDLKNLENDFQSKVQKISVGLQTKQEQIKALTEEISAQQIEKSTLEVALTAAKTKIEIDKIEFNGALTAIMHELNTDISDINKYL
jgi:hypothetical protein